MKVRLRNPNREVAFDDVRSVVALLRRLDLNPESVLVIVKGTLVPRDADLSADDVVEVRPLISGGATEVGP
jgi:sulfur carrier protein